MAENIKQIKDYITQEVMGDEDLLLVQASGTTYALPGRVLKAYAVNAASGEADRAQNAANIAVAATEHPPVINATTGCWDVWDSTRGVYLNTTLRALGRDFTILGYFASLDLLKSAIKTPNPGAAYGVGNGAPYDIYVWDEVGQQWKNNGALTSSGDMNKSVYDQNGKEQDVFAYVDGKVKNVATLDESGKVPAAQLPEMDYIPVTEKGTAGGVASLGADGKVSEGQLPEMASSDDPFAWRTVTIVEPNFSAVTQITRVDSSEVINYYSLPVEIDFENYMYEFRLKAFGLQNRGRTDYFTEVVTIYLNNASAGYGPILGLEDTEGQDRTAELAWFSPAENICFSDKNNGLLYQIVGYQENEFNAGDYASLSYRQPNANLNGKFSLIEARFYVGSKYSVETFGLLFSYRAIARK